jgi:serine/threonine protein kinase
VLSRPVGAGPSEGGALASENLLGERFKIEKELGRGGMGVVLKAHDTLLDRAVAIKMISKELAEGGGLKGTQIIQRFLIEARAAAKLVHPNVVTLYDVVDAKPPYIVMEYVDGTTLRDIVEREGPLELARACNVCAQVAKGLAAAHAQGMIHRDIKPENVIISGEKAKILDFGLAQLHELKKATSNEPILGTPGYMAPEQIMGKEATAASDVFALACVFVFSLTGRDLFDGADVRDILRKVVREDPDLSQLPVGASLRPMITRALSKNPEERPTASEMAEALELGQSEAPDRYADFFDAASQGTLSEAASIPGIAVSPEENDTASAATQPAAAAGKATSDMGMGTIRLTTPPTQAAPTTAPPTGSGPYPPVPGSAPGAPSRATASMRTPAVRSTLGSPAVSPQPAQTQPAANLQRKEFPKGLAIAAGAVGFIVLAVALLWLISSFAR